MDNKLMPALSMLAICLVSTIVILGGLQKVLLQTPWEKKQQRNFFIRITVAISVWLSLLAALAEAGFFAVFTLPPRVVVVVILPVIALLILSFTKKYKDLLRAIPPHWLPMFQSFRIVVECWLWYAFTKGLIPEQMTFEGRNLDIISGILGLVAGWLILRKRKGWKTIAVAYNIIGLALLLNIVIVAILSFPGPTRYFMNEPANRIVTEFPFIYLPGILVVMAFVFHIFSLRQLVLVKK